MDSGIASFVIGASSHLPLLGNWVPSTIYDQYTPRPSDFMYNHFKAYARFVNDQTKADFWNQVAAACQSVVTQVQADYSPSTGNVCLHLRDWPNGSRATKRSKEGEVG